MGDRLRPMSYPQTSAFLLCFSVVSETSYKNIKNRWWPEVMHHCPTKNILVGTKTDLRSKPEFLEALAERGLSVVTTERPRSARASRNSGLERRSVLVPTRIFFVGQ